MVYKSKLCVIIQNRDNLLYIIEWVQNEKNISGKGHVQMSEQGKEKQTVKISLFA